MNQLYITIIIVTLAVFVALMMIYRALFRRKDPCDGCSNDCGNCPVKDITDRGQKDKGHP